MTLTSKLRWSAEVNSPPTNKHLKASTIKDQDNKINPVRSENVATTLISKEKYFDQYNSSDNENSKRLHHPWNKQDTSLYTTGTSYTRTPKLITSPRANKYVSVITSNIQILTKSSSSPSVVTNSIIFTKGVYLVSKSFLSSDVLFHHPSRSVLLSRTKSPITALSSKSKLNNNISVIPDENEDTSSLTEDKMKLNISSTGMKYFFQEEETTILLFRNH